MKLLVDNIIMVVTNDNDTDWEGHSSKGKYLVDIVIMVKTMTMNTIYIIDDDMNHCLNIKI